MGFNDAPGFKKATPQEIAKDTKKAEEMMTPKQKELSERRELSQQELKEKFGVEGHLQIHRDGSSLDGNKHEVWEISGELNGKKVSFNNYAEQLPDGTWKVKTEGMVDGQKLTKEDTINAINKFQNIAVDHWQEEWGSNDANREVQEEARQYAESSQKSKELMKSIGL